MMTTGRMALINAMKIAASQPWPKISYRTKKDAVTKSADKNPDTIHVITLARRCRRWDDSTTGGVVLFDMKNKARQAKKFGHLQQTHTTHVRTVGVLINLHQHQRLLHFRQEQDASSRQPCIDSLWVSIGRRVNRPEHYHRLRMSPADLQGRWS